VLVRFAFATGLGRGWSESRRSQAGYGFDNKEQRVGKTPQEGAAHVPERVGEHDRELPGVVAHAFAQSVYRVSETATQSFGLAFIPVLRMD
jgi:hypothetical protein